MDRMKVIMENIDNSYFEIGKEFNIGNLGIEYFEEDKRCFEKLDKLGEIKLLNIRKLNGKETTVQLIKLR